MIANHDAFSQLFGEKNGPSKSNLFENKFGSKETSFQSLTDTLKTLVDASYDKAKVVYSEQNNGAILPEYDYYKNIFESVGPDVHQYYYQNGMTSTWRNESIGGTFMPAYREAYKKITKQFAGY